MHAQRTRIKKDIVAEFLEPTSKEQGTIILCDGMPTVPCKKELMSALSKLGYWVIHIRYKGTWESSGVFLDKSPHLDIIDTIDVLPKGLKAIWNNRVYYPSTEKIFIFGASFGGAGAILASMDNRVTGIFVLSPVIDWLAVGHLDKMYKLIKYGFGEAYRVEMKGFKKLLAGKFYSPIAEIKNLCGKKIHIVQCSDDELTPPTPVRRFAKIVGCRYVEYKSGGHLSLSKILTPRYWRNLMKVI